MNDKSDIRESVETLLKTLRTERDELRVQLNLAKMEVREQWESVESQWEYVESKIEGFGSEAAHSSKKIVGEIADSYKRLRKTLHK